MKVALCCIGKLENRYSKEFVEYYKTIGFDKIFIYDNNDLNGERFEDVIGEYIDNGFVEIIDCRGEKVYQLKAYQDCYDKYNNEYDWIAFFDFDEFITLVKEKDIKEFLSHERFNDVDLIHVNWMVYDDNELIRYEDKPLLERFTRPKLPFDFTNSYDFAENNHVKSIIRGGSKDIRWISNPHSPICEIPCCNADGIKENSRNAFSPYSFETAYIKHIWGKSIEEYLDGKYSRGRADSLYSTYDTDTFFKVNIRTESKIRFINDYIGNKKLSLFICSHKEFKPSVTNSSYKIAYVKPSIKSDTHLEQYNVEHNDLPLDDKFFSELCAINYVNKNIDLSDYVGFCHYRRYFNFMDKIPNIDDIFKRYDVICAQQFKFNGTVRDHYAYYHNIEDLNIVEDIVKNKFNEYYGTMEAFLNQEYFFPYDMFIMKKDDFKEYCKFVFGVLDEYLNVVGIDINKRIEDNKDKYLKSFSPNDTIEYQYRIGGYLAERLTNVFIFNKYKKIGAVGVNITENKY